MTAVGESRVFGRNFSRSPNDRVALDAYNKSSIVQKAITSNQVFSALRQDSSNFTYPASTKKPPK